MLHWKIIGWRHESRDVVWNMRKAGRTMDGQFFLSWQQDVKIFLYPPILCAVFRAIFIAVYNPYDSLDGHWPSLRGAFRYGFWWGMDFNAYVFLLPFLFTWHILSIKKFCKRLSNCLAQHPTKRFLAYFSHFFTHFTNFFCYLSHSTH